ncbi:S8 family serine peptidase [Kribbella sandramycini]|uniref:S8 family serine peptidase n=1 Tax=Kribbella sandramycini TaxID=60450 RepID=A0A7Y4P032_9ACTN|nr:S8 family serine peptidase [Kribbella sandramycini]MBB6566623.1 subtilisin family serine protease [Kribbella sandramycini]NOL42722.1 S8 family serine peptidase [Kribbella sandramycini]
MRRHGRILVTAMAVLATALAVPYGSAAAPPSSGPPVRPGDEGRRTATVTLVTGDKVTVRPAGDSWEVKIDPVRPVGGPAGGFFRQVTKDKVTVIPIEALPLVKSGVLDRSLFDVTGLVRQRLDDAHTAEIPLLVRSKARKALGFGKVTRSLPSGGLDAVVVRKAGAPLELGKLPAGTKVWLNGRAKPLLDVSVPQIGAPTAWQGGHTGAGVKVAVLDSGYDPSHPDLVGAVKDSKDFIGDGIKDTVGHGTHVASILAGRGTASQGKYTGVAKGADLLIGKVCNTVECPFDAIIAGMQWAAASGAKVVNLSLGGSETDGTDPLSAELNRLTESTGTLFVVAAGNSGPRGLVSSPASADAALTVASVTKQDELSEFSSVGPRLGDHALKPDLAAPGSDIVAARAAGTLDDVAVDEQHAQLSGTSMASPHVAGAAAILAGKYPTWTAAQLKASLMSSAKPIQAGVFAQGTGRVDAARAVAQPVSVVPASVSFQAVRWPSANPPEQHKKVTYRNDSDQPVTLGLRLDFRNQDGQAGAGAKLATDKVTVPAKGSADVTVTAAPDGLATGTYSGRITASTADQAIVVQTTLGIFIEPESYDLAFTAIDRNGKTLPTGSSGGTAVVQSLDDWDRRMELVLAGEKLRLPAGKYAVFGAVDTPVPGKVRPAVTMAAIGELDVRADKVVRVDARDGRPAGVQVDRGDARAGGTFGMMVSSEGRLAGAMLGLGPDQYAIPTTTHADFAYYTRAQLEHTGISLVGKPELALAWAPDTAEFVGKQTFEAADAGRGRAEDLEGRDLTGKLALFTLTAADGNVINETVARLRAAGAAAALFYWSEPLPLSVDETEIPLMSVDYPAAVGLAGQRLTFEGKGTSPYRYELAIPELGKIPANPFYRLRDHQLAKVNAAYHSALPGGTAYTDFDTTVGDFYLESGIWSGALPAPYQRTEYYSPGPVVWSPMVRIKQGAGKAPEQSFRGVDRTYRPGEQLTVNWNKPVHGPGFGRLRDRGEERPLQAYRDGDKLDVLVPLLTDAAGHTALADPDELGFTDKGQTALYDAAGKLIGKTGSPDSGVFTVPAATGRYRLTAEVRRTDPSWPLATRVTADWTFTSSRTSKPTELPLLGVRLNPPVDLLGNAPAGRSVTIPVTVSGGQPRKVEVSYDDGATWTPAVLRNSATGWTATIRHPAEGMVSLRSAASDAKGNQIVQTTYRAYRLK